MTNSFPLTIKRPGNYPADSTIDPSEPTDSYRIVLASDIRRFTASMEKQEQGMILFISRFFEDVAKAIQTHATDSYINKYLGDGMLAHFPSGPDSRKAALDAMKVTLSILPTFEGYTTKKFIKYPGFAKMGLSLVLSRESVFIGTLGVSEYLDYTLLGKSINRVFRALDSAKGNLVLIFDNLKELIEGKYILVDIGLQTYDGLYQPVNLFSVMRARKANELDGKLRLCVKTCSHYSICKRAWERGYAGKGFVNCQECGPGGCWDWDNCAPKNDYGKIHMGHEKFECCHVCAHFLNCFHNYHLGRIFSSGLQIPMIWCHEPFPYRTGSGLSPHY